jgi:hybrid cluster-associated redox disulfide protein
VAPADLLNVLVADVLAAKPGAARVFFDRGMGCVGCTFAPFEAVIDVARAYGIEPHDLARAISEVDRETQEDDVNDDN